MDEMSPALGVWDSLERPCGTDGSRTSRRSEGLGSLRGSTTWSLQDGTAGEQGWCYPTPESPQPLLHPTSSPILPFGVPQTLSQQCHGRAELISNSLAKHTSKPEPLPGMCWALSELEHGATWHSPVPIGGTEAGQAPDLGTAGDPGAVSPWTEPQTRFPPTHGKLLHHLLQQTPARSPAWSGETRFGRAQSQEPPQWKEPAARHLSQRHGHSLEEPGSPFPHSQ